MARAPLACEEKTAQMCRAFPAETKAAVDKLPPMKTDEQSIQFLPGKTAYFGKG